MDIINEKTFGYRTKRQLLLNYYILMAFVKPLLKQA